MTRKPRQVTVTEAAEQTAQIASAVRRFRRMLNWSAERLAEEMTAVGVPWTREVVVNLERGRKRSLGVHELLALAYVLDFSPLDLLVPDGPSFPVTPGHVSDVVHVRAWVKGNAGRPPPLGVLNVTGQDVIEFAEDNGLPLAEWQRQFIRDYWPFSGFDKLPKPERPHTRQPEPVSGL